MNTALVLFALLGLLQGVIEVHSEGKPEPLFNDTIGWEYRLAENAIMLMKLDQHIVKLREKLDRKPVNIEAIYYRVQNAVNRLEGTGCDDHEFQCGSIERQCISKLLICDGVKDCVNGYDEDPSYCDVSIIRAGLSFSGWFTEGTCLHGSRRNLYYCKMRVTSIKRSSIFRSLLPMTMTSTCTRTAPGKWGESQAPVKLSYSVTGHYEVANRRWFSESAGYTSNCQIPDSSFRQMHCETYSGVLDRCNTRMVAYRDY